MDHLFSISWYSHNIQPQHTATDGSTSMYKYISDIPYSGKLSRDKMFANFADLEPFVKVFSTYLKCVSVRVRMRPILPLTHEGFLREIFYFHIFAKVLSLESFPLYGRSRNHSM